MGCLFTQGGGLGGLALGWYVVALSGRQNGEQFHLFRGIISSGGSVKEVNRNSFPLLAERGGESVIFTSCAGSWVLPRRFPFRVFRSVGRAGRSFGDFLLLRSPFSAWRSPTSVATPERGQNEGRLRRLSHGKQCLAPPFGLRGLAGSRKNRLKPQRGGMGQPAAAHAAPTGLGRFAGRGVTINMSPRWGLAPARAHGAAQQRPALDCAIMLTLHVVGRWLAASEAGRSAAGRCRPADPVGWTFRRGSPMIEI